VSLRVCVYLCVCVCVVYMDVGCVYMGVHPCACVYALMCVGGLDRDGLDGDVALVWRNEVLACCSRVYVCTGSDTCTCTQVRACVVMYACARVYVREHVRAFMYVRYQEINQYSLYE